MTAFRTTIAAAAAVATLAFAGDASAGVAFYSFGTGAPALSQITNFSGDALGSTPSTPAGYGWSGNGLIMDTSNGNGAEPAVANGVYGTGNYLSIEGGHSETMTMKAGTDFKTIGLYVGSLDGYNHLQFTLNDGSKVNYSGYDLGAISGANNGAQTAANTNGMFDFSFDQGVKSITFGSDGNSFEIASVWGGGAGVPEPSTWAMLILGVGLVGLSMRRRPALARA